MRRALIYLNLYGCEAVRHKGKNSLKTQILHFLPVFALGSVCQGCVKAWFRPEPDGFSAYMPEWLMHLSFSRSMAGFNKAKFFLVSNVIWNQLHVFWQALCCCLYWGKPSKNHEDDFGESYFPRSIWIYQVSPEISASR